jgi:transposase
MPGIRNMLPAAKPIWRTVNGWPGCCAMVCSGEVSFRPQQVRQWREMTRLCKAYQESLADFKRLIHKLFECANIKLGVVVSDLFGATGRYVMNLLATREAEISADDIAAGAHGQLKQKINELCRALQGFFTDHHRYPLRLLLATVTELEAHREQISQRVKELMADHHPVLSRLQDIPGVSEVASVAILLALRHSHIKVRSKG